MPKGETHFRSSGFEAEDVTLWWCCCSHTGCAGLSRVKGQRVVAMMTVHVFRALFPVEPICLLFCAWLWRWRWGLDLLGEPRWFSGSAYQLSLPTAVGAEWWHQRPRFLCLCSSTELSVEFASSWSQGESCSSRQPVIMSGRWGEMSNDLSLRRFVFYSESPANILGMCVHAKSLQPCLTLCDPMDCSPPGSSVLGVLQAGRLELVAMPLFCICYNDCLILAMKCPEHR